MKFKVWSAPGFELVEGTNAVIERGVLVIFGDDGLPQDAWNANAWERLERVKEEYSADATDGNPKIHGDGGEQGAAPVKEKQDPYTDKERTPGGA